MTEFWARVLLWGGIAAFGIGFGLYQRWARKNDPQKFVTAYVRRAVRAWPVIAIVITFAVAFVLGHLLWPSHGIGC